MKLEPVSVRLLSIGERAALPDKQWADVVLEFRDVDVEHNYSAKLRLLVPKRADVTLREMQEAAREGAVHLLREAASLLERETIEELERQEDERDAADAARLKEFFPSPSDQQDS